MRQRVPSALLVASLGLLAAPSSAFACSRAVSPKLDGYPSEGAATVPTDVVPLYRVPYVSNGDAANGVASATLTDGTEAIPLTPRNVEGTFVEFVPQRTLTPNTQYTLSVVWNGLLGSTSPGQDALSFTTGAGPTKVDDSAPRATISHYTNGSSNTCDSFRNSCFSLTSDEVYLWQFVGADYKRISLGSFETNMFGAEQGHPYQCVVLQRRAANGQLSKSSSVCTLDGQLFDLASLHEDSQDFASPSCEQRGLVWGGELLSKRLRGHAPVPYDAEAQQQHGDAEPLVPPSSDSSAAIVSAEVAGDSGGCSALPLERAARSNFLYSLLALTAGCAWWRRRVRSSAHASGDHQR